jgi:hypothetical protein
LNLPDVIDEGASGLLAWQQLLALREKIKKKKENKVELKFRRKKTTSQSSHTFEQKKTKIKTGNKTVVGKQKPPTPCIS